MYVVISYTPGVEIEGFLALLGKAGVTIAQGIHAGDANTANSPREMEQKAASPVDSPGVTVFACVPAAGLESIQPWLADNPQAKLLLLFTRPEYHLGAAMQSQPDDAAVLAQWVRAAEALLDTHRKHRVRSLILDGVTGSVCQSNFLQACASYLGMDVAQKVDRVAFSHSSTSIEVMLAAQLANTDDAVCYLMQELEASSPPLSQLCEDVTAECRQALEDLRVLRDSAAHAQRNPSESAEAAVQRAEALLKSLENKLHNAERALDVAITEKGSIQRENETVIEQLHKAQQDLEAHYRSQSALERERDRLITRCQQMEATLQQRTSELTGVRSSLSWRITRPLRQIKALISRK